MLVIGLTGGIGSGKTTVSNLFAKYGVPIIDADVIAREITLPTTPAFKEIISHLGDHILKKDGQLDRTALREIIFKNPQERLWLESLLHPLIRQKIEEEIAQLNAPYCITVIPLLFETTAYPFIDRILVIDVPEQIQVKRATERDQSNNTDIAAILKTQVSRETRLHGADDVILNDGTPEELASQVKNLHALYMNKSMR